MGERDRMGDRRMSMGERDRLAPMGGSGERELLPGGERERLPAPLMTGERERILEPGLGLRWMRPSYRPPEGDRCLGSAAFAALSESCLSPFAARSLSPRAAPILPRSSVAPSWTSGARGSAPGSGSDSIIVDDLFALVYCADLLNCLSSISRPSPLLRLVSATRRVPHVLWGGGLSGFRSGRDQNQKRFKGF